VPDDKAAHYLQEIENVIALGNVPEADYVKHELQEFCRRNSFARAHQDSAQLFNVGKADDAYEIMAKAQDRIQQITFDTIDRQWLFDELGDRQRARHREQVMGGVGPFSTGIPELDHRCDGGVHSGELWAVFAYAKRGKTTWLINQGYNALRMYQAPVLHIQLEGQGKQAAARYDACFSEELYTNVKHGTIDAARYRSMQSEYARLKKLLVIRTLNDWDVNVGHIKAEMQDLRAYGFKPELLVVDYMDLLRSRYRVDGETQNQVEAARDLKRLVNQEDIACWSAWQATRPKPGAHKVEHILTQGNVADAYAKVRIVDAFGSLNATDDEMEIGEMRVFWEGHRDAPVGKVWRIANDLSRMRMVTDVLAQEEEPDAPAM
jgi:replicative DNA helicase